MHANVMMRETCRSCGSGPLKPVLSLGELYVSDFVSVEHEQSLKVPLELVLCDANDGGCGLLQLKHTTPPELLYSQYWYKSGISTTIRKDLNDIVDKAERLVRLKRGDIALDIGCNDGTLLRCYRAKGLVLAGFEPSRNLVEEAKRGTSKIINNLFNSADFVAEFGGRKAKIVTAISMFYDLEDPNEFLDDMVSILDPNGLFVIQQNYLATMIENNAFDNICHEHLEYYSLTSLENLLNRHDMEPFDVELNDVNGGSFRIYVRHKGGKVRGFSEAEKRLKKLKDSEKRKGFGKIKAYDEFAREIEEIRRDLMGFLNQEVKKGKRIFIYGASTRGLVVLQYFGIDKKLVEAAVDKNPDKWGKYIVGTGIPIMSVEQYRQEKPDYLFVLPYHFIEEIKDQEKDFLEKGGKMIVAIPKFRIITSTKG